MKATGIVRRIDDLGRVVIPKEIRRTMRIREGDPLEIYTNSEIEIHEHIFLRNVLEHFDMNLSVPIEEAEWIIMNGVSNAVPLPGTAEC